ncbi:MW1434 family type I TA system toxin [Schleiferilactobacillus harbinensis]|uniref:Thoeris anti-defense Tad2 family protein n=1 Tax=Schleiferilactobacillus harbinensis TaxID=304207 RepID=UPI0039E82829
MNIQDAVTAALEQGKGITRKSWMPRPIYLIPTNTTVRFVIVLPNNDKPAPRWEPSADDLVANDWIIYG